MSFSDLVARVRTCPEVSLTAIAGRDGIAVESWGAATSEVDELIAEYAGFMAEISSANRELQLGELEQLVVTGEARTVVLTSISPEYFLLAVAGSDGNPGQVRFASRVAAAALEREIQR
jgi:predicted regulator of Ras-like GTPase activity (Roadblock/LC7/MglB family)